MPRAAVDVFGAARRRASAAWRRAAARRGVTSRWRIEEWDRFQSRLRAIGEAEVVVAGTDDPVALSAALRAAPASRAQEVLALVAW